MAKKPKLDPEPAPETEPISPPEGPGLIPPPPEPADLPDYGAPQREAARSDVAYTANGEPYYVPPSGRDTRTNGHPKPVEPRDKRFKRLASARVTAALKRIRMVGQLSARSQYDYTEAQAEKVVAALEEAVRLVRTRFQVGRAREEVFIVD